MSLIDQCYVSIRDLSRFLRIFAARNVAEFLGVILIGGSGEKIEEQNNI